MRFTIKNYTVAITQILERKKKHVDQNDEARARTQGEILAIEDLLRILPTLKTKAQVKEALVGEIHRLRDKNPKFTRLDGWNQVNGHGIEKNLDYGHWQFLAILADVDSLIMFSTPTTSSTP